MVDRAEASMCNKVMQVGSMRTVGWKVKGFLGGKADRFGEVNQSSLSGDESVQLRNYDR